MKQIYTNENRLLAMNTKNILENSEIKVTLKNEHASGGATPGHQVWLELWVDDSDYDKSIELINRLDEVKGESWICSKCNENNLPTFKICWNC